MERVNIAAHLPAMARQYPETMAVVFPNGRDDAGKIRFTHYTFRQLDEESNRLARGFESLGIRRGTRTVLMVAPSLDFFALTFALFKVGAVPVLVDPGIGIRNLRICLAEAEPEAFIGIPKAHLARVILGWARKSLRIQVTVGRRFGWGGTTLDHVRQAGSAPESYEMAETQSSDRAAILFTSGSTGVPKGVVYSHGMFADQVEKLRRLYRIEPGEIDLPTFPLFALFAPALGMTAIIPEMDATRPAHVDPVKIIEAIEQFKVTNMFGSPALINRVGRYGEAHRVKLPTLRRVISAGAPVSAKVLERFSKMLSPGVQIFTPYGATEALPVCSIGSDEILRDTRAQTDQGAGVCVGRPVEGVDVKVIRISDDPITAWANELVLPARQTGEIAVKGTNVTREYFHRPESTALAKITDPAGGFYHRMGDVGYADETGRIWFCGRKSHRVVTPQGILFTIPCEAVFNTHAAVFRTALVGVRRGDKIEPVLCVELEPDARPRNREELFTELRALGAKHAHTRAIQTFLCHPGFPVDIRHNAKIFREQLAGWAKEQLT